MIAGQQLGWAIGILVPLRIPPTLFRILCRLVLVVVGNVVEHEPASFAVLENASLSANAFGDENATDTRRPHHSGRVKLNKLHIDELSSGVIRECVTVTGSLP